jgi:prepilin-type N-terminal cleavage/methylation domain-containing protein
MIRGAADERGMTLVELLVAMSLSVIVFGATLTVFSGMQRTMTNTEEHNDRQQEARVAIDRLARDLRNLASPTSSSTGLSNAPRGVDRNGRYDLIFKTVDDTTGPRPGNRAAAKRVRYCYDGADPKRGRLLMQQQSSASYTPSTFPAATACPAPPGAGYDGPTIVIADHLTNRLGGRDDRPLFVYSSDGTQIPYDFPGAMTATTRVEARLWLDGKPGDAPVETRISSSVILRNQNRPPVAAFTASVSSYVITLNGSETNDPENEQLQYEWYEGSTPESATKIEGATSVVHILAPRLPGTYTFLLKVTDSAGTVDWSDPVTKEVLP